MSSTQPVCLVLGYGANIGKHVGQAFTSKGYKVAFAARSLKEEDSTASQFYIRGDFSHPDDVADIFAKVRSRVGTPHVVIYNAAAATPRDAKDVLGLPMAAFTRDLNINTTSAFAAAQHAVSAFDQLPSSASRTFIYTGNATNVSPIISLLSLGVGKSATAHIIQCAAESYKPKGYKFYYADERKEDGSPAFMAIDGAAHAKLYTALAEHTAQGPWQQTFVKDIGYTTF